MNHSMRITVLVLGFLFLSSCNTDTNSQKSVPSKARDADEIFLENANGLEVVRNSDFNSYSVRNETEEGRTTYIYYPLSNKLTESFYRKGESRRDWSVDMQGVEPDCTKRQIKVSEAVTMITDPVEVTRNYDAYEIMGIGSYRLLCTEY